MKTWSKKHGIPQGLAEQPDKMREQGGEKDWKKYEEKQEYKGKRDDGKKRIIHYLA